MYGLNHLHVGPTGGYQPQASRQGHGIRILLVITLRNLYSKIKKKQAHKKTQDTERDQGEVLEGRKKMASPPPPRVLTVCREGRGEFLSVQDAIDAIPLCNTRRTIIRVSPGVYRQPVYVPKTKNFITLAGCCPETTILTWNNTASHIDHHQVRGVGGGSDPPRPTTYNHQSINQLLLGLKKEKKKKMGFVCLISDVSCDWGWNVWVWVCDCGRGGFYC